MPNGLLLDAGAHNPFKLDPRTKLFLMLVVNVTIFRGSAVSIMALMAGLPLFLLLASGKTRAAWACALAYSAAAAANQFLVPVTAGVWNLLTVMVSGMLYRVMPGMIMGYYLVATTTVSEFVAAMERLRVSPRIIIPVSVMFRFFPTIGEEARAIGDAMRMRGVSFTAGGFWKNPLNLLEYRLVPLLMSTVKIGEELSAAALTRGLGNPVKRTNLCRIGFGVPDLILSTVAAIAFAGFLLL
ncbi:MAG: energy-coupling factor transporter transmembrane component T [Bacillota bacterium]|jgi:energy-coupling factor transporter transmembrane protein EcfT